MKLKILLLGFLLTAGSLLLPLPSSAQPSVSFQVFYDELSPYGVWVDNPQYGYVWMPNVSAGFSPYATNGYWVYTEMGWTWVSDYAWGWAPFHYGRWYNDITYGPMWVPGYEWGPGWVTWRSSASYYGWAPIGPGISLGMAYGSGYYDTYNHYTFVGCHHMGHHNIHNYYENTTNNVTIINNTTVINNPVNDKARQATYNAGPMRAEVEKRVGKPVQAVTIRESTKPTQRLSNNQLSIYRPQMQAQRDNTGKPAPRKVTELKETKTIEQRRMPEPASPKLQRDQDRKSQPRQTNPTIKADQKRQPTGQPQRSQPVPPQRTTPADQPDRKIQLPENNRTPENRQPIQPQQNNREQPMQRPNNSSPSRDNQIQPQTNRQPSGGQAPQQRANPQQKSRAPRQPKK